MTGYNSKRQAAQAKLYEDDDTQVYSETLSLVYQSGFADGKRSAQRKPLTDEAIWQIATDCTIGGDLHADKFARALEQAHNIKERNT